MCWTMLNGDSSRDTLGYFVWILSNETGLLSYKETLCQVSFKVSSDTIIG